ncbi:MAG: RsmE family RNA methyltransferase [Gemmatimonadota bacterium]
MKSLNVLVSPGALIAGTAITADESEAHHLRVRRAAAGSTVMLLDGAGAVAPATMQVDGNTITMTIGAVRRAPPPPMTILAVGAGDKDRFLALAERCTELGVTHLIPLRTERTQAVDTRFRDSMLDKARRRAREACKQCENPWATVVEDSCTLAELDGRHAGIRWHVGAVGGARLALQQTDQPVGWIIGPEGGLTDDEHAFAGRELSATTVSFGQSILRFDTAAVAAAVITLDRRRAT